MRVTSLLAAFLCSIPTLRSQVPGACLVEDAQFRTANGGCTEVAVNLAWSAEHGAPTWNDAVQFCLNLVEGGFDDWRLPTLPELQGLVSHGGYTHLNVCQCNFRYWSSKAQGQWSWAMTLQTGVASRLLKTSNIHFLCVRTAASGLSMSAGGSGRNADISASHLLADGEWTVAVHAPRHAYRPYLLLAGIRNGPGPADLMAPVVLSPEALGSKYFDPGAGRLDGDGRATVRVDLSGLGIPATAYGQLGLGLVLLDPAEPRGVLFPLAPAGAAEGKR